MTSVLNLLQIRLAILELYRVQTDGQIDMTSLICIHLMQIMQNIH
jgi:hypothetical protein